MADEGFAAPREVTDAYGELVSLLAAGYRSPQDASAAVGRALQRAKRADLPPTLPELIAFVRTQLVPVLVADLGPGLTVAILDDYLARHEARSGVRAKEPPAAKPIPLARIAIHRRLARRQHSRIGVLVVDADQVGCAALARALVREHCEVKAIRSLEELGQVVRTCEHFDVVVVDERHPARHFVLETIVESMPSATLVVRSTTKREAALRRLLGALGARSFEVVCGDAASVVAEVLKLREPPCP